MLPENFDINWVDPQIRKLVISINEIPGTNTQTTCEGHYPYCKAWPTKSGWIHFTTTDKGFVDILEDCSEKYSFVNLECSKFQDEHYTLWVNYPEDDFANAETEGLGRLLLGFKARWRNMEKSRFWKDLTNKVQNYATNID